MPDPRDTPAMRQFARFKAAHPGCVLLFRIGDFYETFDDDAVTLHKALGLTLTRRTEGVPMAGVPHHQLEVYLRRLIAQGFRVAVCEQVQDPKDAKGIVERAVTRVLTPGTLVDEQLLDEAAPNRLACVAPASLRDPGLVGAAIVEVSTGTLVVFECRAESLTDELAARAARELIYARGDDESQEPPAIAAACATLGISATPRPAWHFRAAEAFEALREQYGVSSLAGFGLRDDQPAAIAAGALVRHLRETLGSASGAPSTPGASLGTGGIGSPRRGLAHLSPPRLDDRTASCVLDAISLRALEVERTLRGQSTDGSLVGLFLPLCRTSMGKRLLREWLVRPLIDRTGIEARHACVATLVEDRRAAGDAAGALEGIQDVARIAGRLAMGRATPRDLVALARSVSKLDELAAAVSNSPAFRALAQELASVREALAPSAARILESCVEAPPSHMREGGLIRDGVDAELDEARLLRRDASAWLAAYQERLIAQHSLPGIKVGFNRVFGYYIELTTAQARTAPESFTRQQTLKNAERYSTPELRQFESRVSTAEARSLEREQRLFAELCEMAAATTTACARFAQAAAEIDSLAAFAELSQRRGWTRPALAESGTLTIRGGRHPVLESLLADRFVPNDLRIGPKSGEQGGGSPSLALITGPNMAGKSTFIRQVALIVLLAHAGSFVPAEEAVIGLTDRIFTRVGADDALHSGQSTFMVEMTETASILNNATARSLVILDEIGRGTSTLDGLSLAWAVAEHLSALGGPRTLFATHYHELTSLAERDDPRVQNLHVAVREWGDEIVFLHRILPGHSDRSYGIHVAKLAGIPRPIIDRASEILASLAVEHDAAGGANHRKPDAARVPPASPPAGQMGLFTEYLDHPALGELRELKLDMLSPMQAFDAIRRLRAMLDQP
ncbi:MAG: DNA mismatch repair protein MutS [Phycisphaerales bacterium]